MIEIVKIVPQKIGEENSQTVSARDLYKFLGVKRQFSDWIKDQINRGLFEENIDFITFPTVHLKVNGKNVTHESDFTHRDESGKFTSIEYFLTVDTAKHISIMSRTEKGHEIKKYFLKIEKEYFNVKIQEAVEQCQRNQNPKLELIKVRGNGKIIRRSFTDTVKDFIVYAKSQGSQNADRYYLIFTIEIYRKLGLIKTNKDFGKLKNAISEIKLNESDLKKLDKQFNFRDELNIENLTVVSSCEIIVQRIIEDEMTKQTPYKQIFKIAKAQLSTISIAFEPYIVTAKQQLEFKGTLFEFLLLENNPVMN